MIQHLASAWANGAFIQLFAEISNQRQHASAIVIRQMRQQADSIRRSIQEAQIVRPIPEADDLSAGYSGDSAAIRRRQEQKQAA